jgi:hypothetical protein
VNSNSEEANNRNSVRITSRILFGHHKIDEQDFEQIRTDCDSGISLYNRSDLADMQIYRSAKGVLSRIKEKDKDMAIFLQHLDAKLNVLIQKMDSAPSLFDSFTLQKVNIGGNGVAFWNRESYSEGEIVELHLIIPPDDFYINCFAEVVKCVKDENSKSEETTFRVAVKFILVMESDREALVQYNFKQQSLALQRRRLSTSD